MHKLRITCGVDVGSAAVKVALTRSRAGEEGAVLGTAVQRIRRRKVRDVVQGTFEEACTAAGVEPAALDYIASTGDGDTVGFRTGHFYSVSTHGFGARFLVPGAGGAVDVGALHARAMRIDARGRVLEHRMTSQCASGSGQFLENIARYLGVPLEDVGPLSVQARDPEQVSSICAVLAETDVINMVSRGIARPDILKGIHLSIAGRLLRLVRASKVEGTVVLTGGLAHDKGLFAALHELIEKDGKRLRLQKNLVLETHPQAIFAGALGAALLGAYRHDQLEAQGRLEATTQATL